MWWGEKTGGLPLPLGGTSNHFRRPALERAGGWDPYNVTERKAIEHQIVFGLLRGLQRQVQVGLGGMGHAANFLTGRRIEDRERAAIRRVLPLTVDEELGVGIHEVAQ